jgi:hypothetical protein
MDVCLSVVSVVCCQIEVSATNWSLVQRSPTDCGVSLCDLETSWMRRPWPTGGCRSKNKQNTRPYKCGFGIVNAQFRIRDKQYFWHGYVLVLEVCVKSASLTIFRRTCYVITAETGEGIMRPSLRSG